MVKEEEMTKVLRVTFSATSYLDLVHIGFGFLSPARFQTAWGVLEWPPSPSTVSLTIFIKCFWIYFKLRIGHLILVFSKWFCDGFSEDKMPRYRA